MQFLRGAVVGALVLLLAACGPSPQTAKHYQLTGKVVTIDRPDLSLVINGDAVPGFMAAMPMPYKVKNTSELNTLVPGDAITAVIVLQNNDYWLENIRATKHSSAPPVPSSGLHLPSSGDAVPNFELVNQSDKHIFLNQFRGRKSLWAVDNSSNFFTFLE
jgi:protein SCO1